MAISGASRRAASRPRQSNDWMVLRAPALPLRIAADGELGETLGIEGEVGLVGVGLDLDVEAHVRSGHGEELFEGRETLAVDRLLLGILLGVFARRIEPADVVALELGQGERADGRPGGGDPLAIEPRQVGIEQGIVADHHDLVLGDGKVGLERRDAEIQRGAEAGQRVLGRQAARAAMALQVEGRRRKAKRPDCAGERCDRQRRDAWPAAPSSWP